MKKQILILMAIIAVFSACKKDAVNTGKNGKGTVPVTFNIGYSQSTGAYGVSNNGSRLGAHALASVDPVLAANAKTLYIAIYQSDGTRLYLTKQLSTDTVFGKAQYNLPPGTYTVVFAAGQNNFFYSGTALANDNLVYSAPLSGGGTDNSWQDTFFLKESLTVTSTGINQSVTLPRIDSQVIVDIEDAVPSNVKFIQVVANDNSFTTGYPTFTINTATPTGNTGTVIAHSSLTTPITTGGKNTKFAFILLNSSKTYIVQITAADQLPVGGYNGTISGQQIAYARVDGVAIQAGHQTMLNGQLFGGNGMTNTGGFQVTLDPVWDPNTTTIPFQ